MSIPTWTPTTTARIPEARPLATSQSAAPRVPPGVDRPELPSSWGGSVNRGPPGQPLVLSEGDPQRARKLEWWAVSTAHTRGRVALIKVVVGGTQAVRSRAPARRQAGRPRLAQQIAAPEPKRIKLGPGGHVRTPETQGPVEGAFVAAAERLKAQARGRAGPVASPPPPPSVRVPTGVGGCRNRPPSSWSSCRHSPPIFTG